MVLKPSSHGAVDETATSGSEQAVKIFSQQDARCPIFRTCINIHQLHWQQLTDNDSTPSTPERSFSPNLCPFSHCTIAYKLFISSANKQTTSIYLLLYCLLRNIDKISDFPNSSSDKESTCQCRRCGFNPWVGKLPWRRKWQTILVFLNRKFQGQKSLGSYSAWCPNELGMTEHASIF